MTQALHTQSATKSLTIRKVPSDLLERIDAYAVDLAGETAKPSRDAAIILLLNRGLADATRPRKRAGE